MSKKLKEFSLDKHKETGKILKDMRQKIMNLSKEVELSYGTSSKESNILRKTVNEINKLRSKLDSRVFKEYQHKDTAELIAIYYSSDNL